MIDKLEGTNHDIETPGLNNPETYVLTNNRLNTNMVSISSDLNKAPIYKMPYRNSPHDEIEIVMKFNYLNVFKPDEHTEDYHIRKPNDENFLFESGDKKYIYVGEKVFSFETNDIIVNYSLDLGFTDIKFPYAYVEENVYFMLIKNIFLFKNMTLQQKKRSMSIYITKIIN